MNVDHVILRIAFDVHPNVELDTPEIIHPQPRLRLGLDLPNQALSSLDKEIIDLQNNRVKDYTLILIMEHEQSSIVKLCHKPNR